MTTTAPNLGKLFNSRTSRPATPEDIALLAPGDWISERECPWSWQFKKCCQDMAVGVWEGKEFFVPHHLLMVCEIIEGQVVEKFFNKPDSKFKVGDRVQHKVDPQGLGYSGVVLEIDEKAQFAKCRMDDGNVHGFYTESLKHWLQPIKFKKGDRVCDTFPSSKGRIGIITKTSEQWSMVLWDGAQKSERWRHLEIADRSSNEDSWNPADFGEVPHQIEASGQATIFFDDSNEPPEPDDFETNEEFEEAWEEWESVQSKIEIESVSADSYWRVMSGLHPQNYPPAKSAEKYYIRCDTLSVKEQIKLCQKRIRGQRWMIADLIAHKKDRYVQDLKKLIDEEKDRIKQLLKSEMPENMRFAYRQLRQKGMSHQDALTRLT